MIEVVLNIYIRENVELNVLHLLSVVLRKPLNEDIVLSDPRYRVETHYAILRSVEISQVSLNKIRHNVSRFFQNVLMPTHFSELTSGTKVGTFYITTKFLTKYFKWYFYTNGSSCIDKH